MTLHAGLGAKLVLPLGEDQASPSAFSLYEYRRGLPFNLANSKLKIAKGAVEISDLPAGNYVLGDHEGGQYVSITIANTQDRDGLLSAKHRILQAGRRELAVIRSVKSSRVNCMLKSPRRSFNSRTPGRRCPVPGSPAAQGVLAPSLPLMQQVRASPTIACLSTLFAWMKSISISSNGKDQKYPGNMLAQPTLLVRPWEVSVTENADKLPKWAMPFPEWPPPSPPWTQ